MLSGLQMMADKAQRDREEEKSKEAERRRKVISIGFHRNGELKVTEFVLGGTCRSDWSVST